MPPSSQANFPLKLEVPEFVNLNVMEEFSMREAATPPNFISLFIPLKPPNEMETDCPLIDPYARFNCVLLISPVKFTTPLTFTFSA